MKIIDLLNKIAKGEEVPKKIKYNGVIYNKDNDGDIDYYFGEDFNSRLLLEKLTDTNELRDIVEIIEEEKEIEKLRVRDWDKCIHDVTHTEKGLAIDIHMAQIKINELIDVINSIKKEK